MNEQLILKIVESIEPQLLWLFLKLIAIGIVLLVLKGYIESAAAYINFRLDKRLGLGVRVRVRGIEGKIIDYSFSYILIEHKDGIEIISMRRAKFERWTLLNGAK
jgi:hypothetical protein